jgi:hypothetical protein
MVGVTNEAYEKYIGYLNYRLVQSTSIETNAYTREGIAEVIALIGGFIGMMKNFSYLLLESYQTFTIDKSMIKKVLSMRKHDGPHRGRAPSSWNNI